LVRHRSDGHGLCFCGTRLEAKVTEDGVPVSADLVFDCWYGFWPMKSGEVMLMGDTCVRED
jgi:hypothetical protein